MIFFRAFMLISYGSAALTTALILLLRYRWRRSKALQEP